MVLASSTSGSSRPYVAVRYVPVTHCGMDLPDVVWLKTKKPGICQMSGFFEFRIVSKVPSCV